jgi:hypothetical protein
VARILGGRFPRIPYVDVVQTVIGPIDLQHVGPVRESRFRVRPDGK